MSWLKTVLGLVGAAVGSEAGREVVENVRTAMRKDSPPAAPSVAEVETLLSEHRNQVNGSLERLARELATQNERLDVVVRRQRRWNILFAIGIVLALLAAFIVRS